ncbi:unnamed protein product [Callosobruchus maculatus]|uniref:Uncharacterized protein n=1 Tax=Callosobruchus maculatus TaxID=64391 RepID=A0A653DJ57_CALMS|nr:unnamed protein product [Callosobruchus maculatus]
MRARTAFLTTQETEPAHFGSFRDVMVTPYFSKLCHDNTCLLNAPSNLIFTATRFADQRTEVHKTLNYFTTAY